MAQEFSQSLQLLFSRVLEVAASDPELRRALRDVAGRVLEQCRDAPGEEGVPEETPVEAAPLEVPAAPELPLELPPIPESPLMEEAVPSTAPSECVNSGRDPLPPASPVCGPGATQLVYSDEHEIAATVMQRLTLLETSVESDSTRLEELCEQLQLKSEACAWALAHCGESKDLASALWARGEGKERHLWMLSHRRPSTAADPAWQRLAEAFDAAARSAELLLQAAEDAQLPPGTCEEAARLCHQAQRMLRNAVTGVEQGYDLTHRGLERWLSRFAQQRQWQLDSPAAEEADCPAALLAQTHALQEQMELLAAQNKARQELLKKARYHQQKIVRGAGDSNHDWRVLSQALNQLVAECGAPPSNKEIRGILLPIYELLPEMDEDLPGFDLCLRALDTFLDREAGHASARPEFSPAAEVEIARKLLEQRRVVLIGGNVREHSKQRIEQALRLKELNWVPSKSHQSIETFRPMILQPDVAVVVLAIRWSSHSFGELREYCRQGGVPFVRLSGGYGVNQFARQIVEQAGECLQRSQDRPEAGSIAV